MFNDVAKDGPKFPGSTGEKNKRFNTACSHYIKNMLTVARNHKK
tara:strand:+ start:372 stop:503 length:132 start_codon:yes stop_codon:yes gene_type:complete